jgi:hypothetical protein
MSVNAARYGLITHEYRFVEAYDSVIDTRYSKARVLEIPTHLDIALVATLVTDLFNVVSPVRRRFIVELDGTEVFTIDDFANGSPTRFLTSPEHGVTNKQCIVTRVEIDEDACKTIAELWG